MKKSLLLCTLLGLVNLLSAQSINNYYPDANRQESLTSLQKEELRQKLHSLYLKVDSQDIKDSVKKNVDLYLMNSTANYTSEKTNSSDQLKSASLTSGRLDSIMTSSWKHVFSYDENGHLSEEYGYLTRDGSKWEISYRDEYEFDVNGNMLKEIWYWWEKQSSSWEGSIRTDYSYDDQDRETLKISYDWNDTIQEWEYDYKIEYSYDDPLNEYSSIYYYWRDSLWVENTMVINSFDSYHNLLFYVNFDYDNTTQKWDSSGLRVNEYDNDLLVGWITYEWENGARKKSTKSELFYSAGSNNSESSQSYNWDDIQNIWILSGKSESTYTENGKPLSTTSYTNNGYWVMLSENEWDYDEFGNEILFSFLNYADGEPYYGRKWIDEYNTKGQKTIEEIYKWNDDLDDWFGINKYNSTYNEGNMVSQIRYSWDDIQLEWIMYRKSDYNLNISFNQNDVIIPFHRVNSNKNIIDTVILYNYETSEWEETGRNIYFYSGLKPLNIESDLIKGPSLYPNPLANYFEVKNIDVPFELNLYDLNGKTVFKIKANGQQQISVSELPSGIYFYRILTENKNYTGKLLKN